MFTEAFSRSRSPMRGSAASSPSPASWRAGKTNALRLRGTVMRRAWRIAPRRTSS
jgi:hypothetical protein